MVPSYDFPALVRGDTARLALVFKRRSLFESVITRLDLTGATVTWTVKRPGQVDLVKSTANGGLVLDAATSTVSWAVAAADTTALSLGANTYRIRIQWPDGRVETHLEGSIPARD